MHSPLGRLVPKTWADAEQLKQWRKRAWHEDQIAILPLNEIRDDWTRQAVKNEANRLYGMSKAQK